MRALSPGLADWRELQLEPVFAVDPTPSGGVWGVVDAEGRPVAFCRSEQLARVVAAALESYAEVMG